MKVKECLILAAGLGTRMGEVGKYIPKPLWPLFDREILYFQLSLLQRWGISRVYINVHHQAELIEEYVEFIRPQLNLEIVLLKETTLLDSGGGVINCLNYVQDDYLLVVNADVFYLVKDLPFLEKPQEDLLGVMFAIDVKKNDPYNRLIVEQDRLKKIVPPSDEAPNITFSGVSLINKKAIELQKGPSKFFETVLNYRKGAVAVRYLEDYEYVDVGTIDNYVHCLERVLLDRENSLFKQALKDAEILVEQKVGSYTPAESCYWNYQIISDRITISSGGDCSGHKGICIGSFKSDLRGLPLT